MKLLGYVGFAIFGFGLFYLISFFGVRSEHPALSHEAVTPDIYLRNSKVYLLEHAHSRSLNHLDKAINAIRAIEAEIDPESQKTVDRAIHKLEIVYNEILADTLHVDDMNQAFVNALNALTFAEIKVTEHFIESHNLDKARVALKHGMLHIKNALKYSKGTKRDYEVHLYEEMDSIIKNEELSDNEIILRLEHLLSELDTAIVNE